MLLLCELEHSEQLGPPAEGLQLSPCGLSAEGLQSSPSACPAPKNAGKILPELIWEGEMLVPCRE